MNPGGLAASAAINLGLAVVVLSLFSVLKRQPYNAPVYLAKCMSTGESMPGGWCRSSSARCAVPSFAWIPAAFRLSEEEVIRMCGLDALVVLRLFKFGMKFFSVCSLVGLLILVPVNYYASQESSDKARISHSLDSFSISKVERGSNWLWVHFSCLCIISFYVTYLLHKEYKEILEKRIRHLDLNRKRPDQFTVLVRGIPLCMEHREHGCYVDHFFSKHYNSAYYAYQIVHDRRNIEQLMKSANSIEQKIKRLRNKIEHQRSSVFASAKTESIEKKEAKLEDIHRKIRGLQCGNMLKQKDLPVAFVTFKSRVGATLAAEGQQHENPLLLTTEHAPEPKDVLWHNLDIPYRCLVIHRIGVFVAAVLLTVFFTIPVTAVQGIVQFEKIKQWFPPARAVQLIPGLNSILTGYLPSAILNGFIYLIPYAMLGMASLGGMVSKSKKEMKACSMVFYFLVGNVFFLSVLSGSLLNQIGKSFAHPKEIPSRLASAVSAQSDFFITYILTDGMSGFSFEVLQFGFLTWNFLKGHLFSRESVQEPYLYGFPYYRVIPIVSLAILIGMVYAVIAPLLLPFLVVYFLLGYAVFLNQASSLFRYVCTRID
ncbi:CSC1-like protein [Carex littledalei]|uniref:CSC1-like protein n=1 Tax=Carex littledalei TaxID=544730 RepID=A0A833RBV5_9POAL|nr:CSC1-like protein [Carex littledalei]